MKKFILLFLSLLHLNFLQALPVGNPSDVALYPLGLWVKDQCCLLNDYLGYPNISFRFGYYGDFVFNRNLIIQGRGLNQGRVIRETIINTNAGYLAFNFCEKIDVFGTLGASHLKFRTSEDAWDPRGGSDGTLYSDTNFSWSIGARGCIFHWCRFDFGVEGQYFQANPRFSQYISGFVGDYVSFNSDNDFTFREWQAGGVLSYNFATSCPDFAIVPYIAGKWAYAQVRTHNFQFIAQPSGDLFTIFNLESHKHWGFAFGATFALYGNAGITVEGRIGDEKAIYVNSQICF